MKLLRSLLGVLCGLSLHAQETDGPLPAAEVSADPASFKTVDDLWSHLDEVERGYTHPHDTPERVACARAVVAAAQAFITQYPTDNHATDAKIDYAESAYYLWYWQQPNPPSLADISKVVTDLAADDDLTRARQGQVRDLQISIALENLRRSETNDPAQWQSVDEMINAFRDHFGDDFSLGYQTTVLASLRGQELVDLVDQDTVHDPDLLQKLTHDSDPAIAHQAQGLVKLEEVLSKMKDKMELTGVAVDGRTVDLSQLRGKVVLIDFWASWCPGCVGETPYLLAVYKKYHDQGLEIIGISLDTDKAALQKYVQDNGMEWPQLFDGAGWSNSFAQLFDIHTIPAMWLVDRQGKLATRYMSDDLDSQVEGLLKKPNP
jgi:thiol-disulfide isomerase/thioredoxin